MTKANIFYRLAFIYVSFLIVGKLATYFLHPIIGDPLTLMMVVKWILVAYVLGLAYHFNLFSEIGLRQKGNWKSLILYWPIWLIVLLSLAGGWQSTDPMLVINIALFVIAVGITEEVIFRGFFFHYLKKLQPSLVILISSIAFGSMHMMGFLAQFPTELVLAQVYFAAGSGMILGNAKARYGALSVPIFVHAAFDFAALGAKGGIQEFVYDEQIVFGMLFGGTILWAWGIWLLYIGKRRNSFLKLSTEF